RGELVCDEIGIRPTLFAIGRDVDGGGIEALKRCASAGAELAAHSYQHDYAMASRDVPFVFEDVARVAATFTSAFGKAPTGFRAPGYLVSQVLYDALVALGFTYDSSVLPSPSYYAVKAVMLTAYKIFGKTSAARYGDPCSTLKRTAPYREGPLVELPIAVTTLARLPLTATALMLAPKPLRLAMLGATSETVVINAHAMDFVDAKTDGLSPALATRQPELRISIEKRLASFRDSVRRLLEKREALTCTALAARA
ncbi:MAG: polysaccharide deacetylase family protein, partial [Clostridia bacterium]|nr:polysaccharide deacetylase family protein [Deltaproteobacteria bacterium]